MPGGRPPKPTAELLAAGTWQKCRHADRGTEAAIAGKPRRPKWLTDPIARYAWNMIIRGLHQGVLATVDSLVLAGACQWFGRWHRHTFDVKGDEYKAAIMAGIAWKHFVSAASKLGMTPIDRERLKAMPPPAPVDPKARFFERKTG